MPLAIGLAILLVAIALLSLFGSSGSVMGLEPGLFASIASAAAMLLLFSGTLLHALRENARLVVQALLFWTAAFIGMMGLYAHRFELQGIANRTLAAIVPGDAVTARGGEVIVGRAANGTFAVEGRVNEVPTRFIVDTGASAVVLTSETAAAAGIALASLDYSVAVSTANGRTQAAPVRLDAISIGGIRVTRVEALVSRPGALRANLLGMTYLEQLDSYEVRGDRLVLRGR
jgi:aspartyl protease family protein